MKSTFSKKFINMLVLSGLVLSLVIFGLRISSTADAQTGQPGGGQGNLLDSSGGVVTLFELWPKTGGASALIPSLGGMASLIGQTTSQVVFRQLGTTILGDIFGFGHGFFNEMYVGFSSMPSQGGGQFEADSSQGLKLQVDGKIQIKGLAHSNPTPIKLCANDFGRLAHCSGALSGDDGGGDGGDDGGGSPTLPVNGVCGSAHGTYYDPRTPPPSISLCSAGTPSTPTFATGWSWTCSGSNGGSNASCSTPSRP